MYIAALYQDLYENLHYMQSQTQHFCYIEKPAIGSAWEQGHIIAFPVVKISSLSTYLFGNALPLNVRGCTVPGNIHASYATASMM